MRILLIILVAQLQACAVYTTANTAAFVATDKSITDHALTLAVPNSDCNITNLVNNKYYCEIRDISRTYNRNPI
jgi:hypothetical protein